MVEQLSKRKLEKQKFMASFMAKTKKYSNIILFNIDNVGAHQLQQIRIKLRGRAEIVCGKNTVIKKAIQDNAESSPDLLPLADHIKQNICFVFSNEPVVDIRDECTGLTVPAAAKAGQTSTVEVVIPAGNTGMEPTKTSFFQVLGIPTRITRGAVDIVSNYTILRVGDVVNPSHAQLLQMMDIKPFEFGMKPVTVYESGSIYAASVLDLTDDDMAQKMNEGIRKIAAIGLATGIPNSASVPHSVISSFKNLLSVACATNVTFKQAENIKEYLADPSKFASAAPATTESSDNKDAGSDSESESSSEAGLGAFF